MNFLGADQIGICSSSRGGDLEEKSGLDTFANHMDHSQKKLVDDMTEGHMYDDAHASTCVKKTAQSNSELHLISNVKQPTR
mmetsp:Transcript_33663/g.51983  ORF Transcript_33663/g.51983 Transcript_33663/m.51983 type:complete len:81 (-) Transcript_33663:2393-2635(-)